MSNTAWWGGFDITEKQSIAWTMGNRRLVIRRDSFEYYVWNALKEEISEQNISIDRNYSSDDLNSDDLIRHLNKTTDERIIIEPKLADRSVVAKPSATLKVMSKGEAQIYVSTPLWFSAKTSSGAVLIDTPWQRPSDSWFGPSTRIGELCYAKYTDARLNSENIEYHSYRAVSPIKIINRHPEALSIEKINVPVRLLQVYHDEDSRLWTQPLTITREADEDNAEIQLDSEKPDNSPKLTLVSGARDISEKKTLIRNLTSLFS